MELTQAIILFFAQSVFFIIVLCLCLFAASKKNRSNLKEAVDHLNKSKQTQTEETKKSENSKALLEKLKEDISKLQNKISTLEKVEQQYYELKDSHQKEILELQEKLLKAEQKLNKEDSIDVAENIEASAKRSSDEVKKLLAKIEEQKQIIESLKKEIQSLEKYSSIESIKYAHAENALNSIKQLEESLRTSQLSGEELEANFDKIKRELDIARGKLDQQEAGTNADENEPEENQFVINTNLNQASDQELSDNSDLETALRNYDKMKSEVEMLRNNTTQQRQLIFTLESEIIELRKETLESSLTDEEKKERESKIQKLEGLLRETENCIEVLESEVTYLQDKLANSDDTSEKSFQEMYQDTLEELNRVQNIVDRTTNNRARLSNIIRSGTETTSAKALDFVSKTILEAIVPLKTPALLKIKCQLGNINASTGEQFDQEIVAELDKAITDNNDQIVELDTGFIASSKYLGIFAQDSLSQLKNLDDLRDTINFILLVSNSVIASINERQSLQVQKASLTKLVDGVKSKISTISIQNKYQSDEAKNIFNALVNELNTSLNTMNITENQSKFFDQMIEESKQRMSLLLAGDVVVDKSFSDLLGKIEGDISRL